MTLATALFGAGVKSVQAGTITIISASSNTATISSVNTSKSVVLYGGTSMSGSADYLVRVELTNATTVTATRGTTLNNSTVAYTVLEFY